MDTRMNRRGFVLGSLLLPLAARAQEALPAMQVWKSSTCTCCSKWVTHIENAGFTVTATDVADVNVYKQRYGLPPRLASCHTALVGDYVVEGHVPAEDVLRLVQEKPAIKGIAVPGMPIGSPGMEGPNPQRYQTIAFDDDGQLSVFAEHGPTS